MREKVSSTALIQACEELLQLVQPWKPDGSLFGKTQEEEDLEKARVAVFEATGALAGRLVQDAPLETVSPQLLAFVRNEAGFAERGRRSDRWQAILKDPTLTWGDNGGYPPLVPPGMELPTGPIVPTPMAKPVCDPARDDYGMLP